MCADQLIAPCVAQQASTSGAIPGFHAKWIDGHVDKGELTGWNDPAGSLLYQGRSLFGSEITVRWLRGAKKRPGESASSGVELVGGDFFPGDVVGSAVTPNGISSGEYLILVQPAMNVDVSGMARRTTIPIHAPWLQRIVWKPKRQPSFEPQTAFLRDGRVKHFRSIHWMKDSIRLLEDDKIETVRFDELAELHLAAQQPWQAYLNLLAELNPDCEGKLAQIQATNNVRLTTSSYRLRLWSSGQNQAAAEAVIITQPAWTTAGLAIPLDNIEQITIFTPQELPLTRLSPTKNEHRGFVFDYFVPAQIDASVLGSHLISGGTEYAWGFGVQAEHLLEFQVPAHAQRVETWVGLDHAARDGGCAQGRMEIGSPNASSEPSAIGQTSPLLIGSAHPPTRLQIELTKAPRGATQLRLIADSVNEQRPIATDPFEVRDFVDWLEPLVILDHEQLVQAVRHELPRTMPELRDWKLSGDWRRISQWRPGGRPTPGFRSEVALNSGPLILSQVIEVRGGHSRLVIHANQLPGKSPRVELRIRIDGRSLATAKLPVEELLNETPPIIVDLAALNGKTARIDLEFRAEGPHASFELRSAGFQNDR
jgi:hypothetical protein